jgi:hypothetical protein
VGVTGSRITMHKPRFWDELPLKARVEGRVLLFCETGMVLYRSDTEGNPVEDETYGPFPGNTKRFLRQQTIDRLVSHSSKKKTYFIDKSYVQPFSSLVCWFFICRITVYH